MKIIENIAEGWDEMDGDSIQEKKLNAYLTFQFTSGHDMPSDECLREAKLIISFLKGEVDLFGEFE